MWPSDTEDGSQRQQQPVKKTRLSETTKSRYVPEKEVKAQFEQPPRKFHRTLEEERASELKLRERPLPTRRRGDTYWELHVRNFPYDTTEEDLRQPFLLFNCLKVRLKNPADKKPFAFIQFAEYEDAAQAFATLDGTDFNGRRLIVAFSKSSFITEADFYKHRDQNQLPVQLVTSDNATNAHQKALDQDVRDQRNSQTRDTRDRDCGIGRHDRWFGQLPRYQNSENSDDEEVENSQRQTNNITNIHREQQVSDSQFVLPSALQRQSKNITDINGEQQVSNSQFLLPSALQRQSNNITDINGEQQVSSETCRSTEIVDEDCTVEASVAETVRARWSQSAQQRSLLAVNPECSSPVSQVSPLYPSVSQVSPLYPSVSQVSPLCPSVSQVSPLCPSSVLQLNGDQVLQVSLEVGFSNPATVKCSTSVVKCNADDGKPTRRSISGGFTLPVVDIACNACPDSVFLKSPILSSHCEASDDVSVRSNKLFPNSCSPETLKNRITVNGEMASSTCILHTQSSYSSHRTIDNREIVISESSKSFNPFPIVPSSETPISLGTNYSNLKITGNSNLKLFTLRRRHRSSNWTQVYSRTQPFKLFMKVYSREECADIGQVCVRFSTGSLPEDTGIPSPPQVSSSHISGEFPILSETDESQLNPRVGMVKVRNDSPRCNDKSSLCVSEVGSLQAPLKSDALQSNRAYCGNMFDTLEVSKCAQDPGMKNLVSAKYEDTQRQDGPVNNVRSNEFRSSRSKTDSRKDKSTPKLKLGKLPESMTKKFLDDVYDVTCRPSCALQSVLSSSESDSVQLSIFVTHADDLQHFWGQVLNDGNCFDEVRNLHDTMAKMFEQSTSLGGITEDVVRAGSFYGDEEQLYRVIIKSPRHGNEAWSSVFYVDYGNTDKVKNSALRVLPDEVWNIAPAGTPFCYIGNTFGGDIRHWVNREIIATVAPPRLLYQNQSQHMVLLSSLKPSE